MDTITTIPSLLTCIGSAQPVTVALTPSDIRLIAAAPESHEANKLSLTVLCAIRAAGVLSHDTNILRDLDSAIGANRAAIAKATGEQS